MRECLNPEARYEVGPPLRCHRATAIAVAQKQYFDASEGVDTHARALMWSAQLKGGPGG